MEFVFIFFAFICGLFVRAVNLPPLLGFLIAGFLLNLLGYESNPTLDALAQIGITLMLFTIGLKLNVRDLYKTEVWFGSSVHMLTWILICTSVFTVLALAGVSQFAGLKTETFAPAGFRT